MKLSFSINDYVWVRLTDEGREIYAAWADDLSRMFPTMPPIEQRREVDGWSRWQLWELMEMFGSHIGLASGLPFETEIRLEAP